MDNKDAILIDGAYLVNRYKTLVIIKLVIIFYVTDRLKVDHRGAYGNKKQPTVVNR